MESKADFSTKKGAQIKSHKKKKFTSTDWAGYLFSTPLVIGVLVFSIYPMFGALVLSFQKSDSSFGGEWTGLSNYKFVFSDSVFWKSLYNTVYIGGLAVVLGVSFSFILATLMIIFLGLSGEIFSKEFIFFQMSFLL